MKEQCSIALIEHGALFVMITGAQAMQELYADNLDM